MYEDENVLRDIVMAHTIDFQLICLVIKTMSFGKDVCNNRQLILLYKWIVSYED